MMKYHEQIKHPLWQKKRLEVLEFQGFQCMVCTATDKELHIHHPFYKRGAMIWEYETNELQCLCNECHKNVHAIDERIAAASKSLCNFKKLRLLGFLEAMANKERTSKNLHYLTGYINGFSGDNINLVNSMYADYYYE